MKKGFALILLLPIVSGSLAIGWILGQKRICDQNARQGRPCSWWLIPKSLVEPGR